MSTKVISAKISTEDYDKLLDTCNNKGCSISEFVRQKCLDGINPNISSEPKDEKSDKESKENSKNFFRELEFSILKDKLKRKENELAEFYELFSEQEIFDKRIHRSFQNVKKNDCFKMK